MIDLNKEPDLVEIESGTKFWFVDGRLHRKDGPAFEDANGDREWRYNGELHREDGPAVEEAGGSYLWYLNSTQFDSIQNWAKAAGIFESEEYFLLFLKYG